MVMSYNQPLHIKLDRPHNFFTNLDEISGSVQLSLLSPETIAGITVKLEAESRTRLAGVAGPPGGYDPYARNQTQLEVHKLLYKIATVFPTPDVARANPRSQYTLSPGQYSYPFQFKIPFNNDCINNNSVLAGLSSMRLDMMAGPNGHVKKTLPPTLGGLPGEAEIQYYVKVTVQRPAFYKENWRQNVYFPFLPIEPPRPPPNKRESFARVQHQFAPPTNAPEKPGLFRRASSVDRDGPLTPPSVSMEGRLPDPAILTCNEPLPLRVLVTKLNDSPATVYLEMLHIELLAFTTIRAQLLRRNEVSSWTLLSSSNMHKPLNEENGSKVVEIPPELWTQRPLPSTVSPTFHTCNISRTYGLHIKIGISWSVGSKKYPEMNVQLLRMPCEVFSGVAPPAALLEAMANRPDAASEGLPPAMPTRPPGSSNAATANAQGRPQQPSDHIEPSPEDIPVDAPPSYADAIADSMEPVDGPRREYQQTQPPAFTSDARPGSGSGPGSGAGGKGGGGLFDHD